MAENASPTGASILRTVVLYDADEWGSACPTLRVVGPAQAAGLEVVRGCAWSEGILQTYSTEAIASAGLVIIQRDFPRFQEAYTAVLAAVREHHKPMLYELDDLLLELPPDHPSYEYYLAARGPVLAAIAEADSVTTSTPELAAYLGRLNPRVTALPNVLNEQIWKMRPPQTPAPDQPVVIGYVGGHTHAADLAMVAPALLRLLQRYGDRVRIHFWSGTPPPALEGLAQVTWTPMHILSYAEYAATLPQQRMDICLAPLRDNLFNRCKSAIKFIEYSALGVAGVYSRLAPYSGVVQPGQNGMLAGTEDEWESALAELIERPDLRYQLALQAQATVREHWRLEQHAPVWAAAYGRAAAAEPGVMARSPQARAAGIALSWQTELLAQLQAKTEALRVAESLAKEVGPLQIVVDRLSTQSKRLVEITSSPSYSIMQGLAAVRRRVMPRRSRTERLADLTILGYRYWRQAGTREAVRRSREVLARKVPGGAAEIAGRLARRGRGYEAWIRANEPGPRELAQQRQTAPPAHWPKISVVVPVFNPGAGVLADTIASVRGQTYPNWELCLADGHSDAPGVQQVLETAAAADNRVKVKRLESNLGIAGNLNEAVGIASGEYVMLLDHDDLLAPNALFAVAEVLGRDPALDLVYFDEDKVAEDGRTRREPWFKPSAWSADLLLSTNLYMHSVIRRQCVLELGGFDSQMDGAQDWDLALRMVDRTRRIAHIPRVLYHWRQVPGSAARDANAKPWAFAAQERLILAHLQRLGVEGARVSFPSLGRVRVHWPTSLRQVAIIIPTKDKLEQLRPCVESILQMTGYPDYAIVLVDTGSLRQDTWSYYADLKARSPRVRVVHAAGEFNYSHANNLGASQTNAELLLFLNNDVEVLAADWLDELVGWAERPGVGIVGAKLLRPDGTIQHAGLVMGLAGHGSHAFDGSPEDTYGPFGSSEWYRDYQAVTGACMMVSRAAFNAVNGFDEAYRIGYGDIEFCLRAVRAGYRVVYTPFARLFHHEGASRGFFNPPGDVLRAYWQMHTLVTAGDPFFSPNLDYSSRQPAVAPPRQPPREAQLDRILADYELVFDLGHLSPARPNLPAPPFRLASGSGPVDRRVLLVSHELSQSGAPLILASLARQLKQAGWELAVLSPLEGPLRATYEQMNIEVQVDPAAVTDARAVMSRLGGFGLVLANTIVSWRAVFAARASRVPCLWWIHESQYGQSLAQHVPAVAQAFGAADKVMFPAAANARLYTAYVRPEQQAIFVGIDSPVAAIGSPPLERPAGKQVVVCAASFERRKGQDVLLAALAHLPPELRDGIQLYLLGQVLDPRYYRRLVNTARQYPGVQFLNAMPHAEALKYLSGADVIVLASRDEVVPLVLLEAMALGKGIVATSVGGIPDVVEHGAHAWLVPPDDPAALAQALARMLQEGALRTRLGSAAQKRFTELYTFDRFVDDVSGLMRQLTTARQIAGQAGMIGQRELPGEPPVIYQPPVSFMRMPDIAPNQ